MSRAPLRLVALNLIPAATATLCALALAALNGGGEARLGPVALLKLAAGYSRPAEKLLAPANPPPDAAAEAARLSRAALAQFPYDNSSWLRLAYADRLQNGRLTPEGVRLLQRSYDLVGVDIYAGVWRIAFVLENSQDIPRDLRLAAKNEFEALWGDSAHRGELRQMAARVQNPAGRLSAALWLNNLQRTVAK